MSRFGLRLNVKKTEYLTTEEHESGISKLMVRNFREPLRSNTSAQWFHQTAASPMRSHHASTLRGRKWRSLTGVLCDKDIPDRLKSKIYRTVLCLVALYGTKYWPTTEEMERRISVIEMRMLRWMGGITQPDRISNKDIRQRSGVVAIAENLHEVLLRWFGHVLRADGDKACKIGCRGTRKAA